MPSASLFQNMNIISGVLPDLQTWLQQWFCLATRRPYSVIRVFLKEIPAAGHGENTQPWAFSSKSHSHSASFLSFSFLSLYIYIFSFSFLLCSKECSLYRVAGVHWSASTPMSHTHPMCLLLATLDQKEGRREIGGSQKERERGEGEESPEFDMLCAWVTCIKQRRGK